MNPTVDYYLAVQSPWSYLGHARFVAIAEAARAKVRVLPIDLGKVFPVSGGLPLGQRAPQRQAYRLVELRRFATYLQLPINVQPKFFPVAGHEASQLILAVDEIDGSAAALRFTGAVMAAVWTGQRNIADGAVLAMLLQECGLTEQRLEAAREPGVQQRYEAGTQAAIEAGVFGAPTYCVDGEMFWGQDRLDFVQRRLHST